MKSTIDDDNKRNKQGCERKAIMSRAKWLMGAVTAIGLAATSLQPAAAQDHRGGTMRLLSEAAGGSLDPKIGRAHV